MCAIGSLVLKHPSSRWKSRRIDPDFAEALCESESNRLSVNGQAQRKTQQFCRQVQRALNMAMAGGLYVEEVAPAPDCGRLLVQVLIPSGRNAAEEMDALRRDEARLRSEVAMAITRKRAPQLYFVPVCEEGGCDE